MDTQDNHGVENALANSELESALADLEAVGEMVQSLKARWAMLLPEDVRRAQWVARRQGAVDMWGELRMKFPQMSTDICAFLHAARQDLANARQCLEDELDRRERAKHPRRGIKLARFRDTAEREISDLK